MQHPVPGPSEAVRRYGFEFASDDMGLLMPSPVEPKGKTASTEPSGEAEGQVDYGRLKVAIKRNREWFR